MSEPDVARFVDVFELARRRGQIDGRIALRALPRLVPALARTDGDLQYSFRGFVDAQGRPAAQLSFSGVVQLVCDRCADAVAQALDGDAQYYFVRSERELERIPVEDSVEEPLLGSPRFDLHELLEDEAILALPAAPRHASCHGAAPTASTDRGTMAAATEPPHPFAALAQLRPRRK